MGFILSKFRRSKPSTKDQLENIEKEMREIYRFQIDTQLKEKKILGRILLVSTVLYLAFAAIVYLLRPPDLDWTDQLMYFIPFVVFPALVWLMRQLVAWWYERKIVLNKEKYESLKKEKQKILDDVMENETFKVAKEILEKFAPSQLLPKYLANQQLAGSTPRPMSPATRTPGPVANANLRRRAMANPQTSNFTPRLPPPGQYFRQSSNTFRPALMPPSASSSNALNYRTPAPSPGYGQPPRLMLPPTPVNPTVQNRSMGWMDKLVEYVIGDGAQHRFALICRYCATHNGLATPEDFPYIGYRCVYCRQYNPPRQQRPQAATLPKNTILIEEMDASPGPSKDVENSSEQKDDEERTNEKSAESGEENEPQPLITSPTQDDSEEKDEMEIISDEEVNQAQLNEQNKEEVEANENECKREVQEVESDTENKKDK